MTSWTGERIVGLLGQVEKHVDAGIELRRRLHEHPRISGSEGDTTVAMLEALDMPAVRLSGGGAVLRVGDPDGPAIGLRAELDALPVVERTGASWAATNGAMHACGHDVHLAAAYVVAKTLHEYGGPMPLVLALQPREETLPSGARDVVTSEAFTRHDIRAFIGAHVQPRLRAGEFSAIPGPVNAAADEFTIVIEGRPGHAAYPHLTADPVVASADLIGTLQHLVSRQVDPTNPTVLTVGSISGGNSPNIVPACVRMRGILRTFDEHDRTRLHEAIRTTSRAIAGVHQCDAEVSISTGAPVLHNDPTLATQAAAWIEEVGFEPAPPLRSCGADDFSYFCPVVPSLMVFAGVGSGEPDTPGLHHPRFLPPDQAVPDLARLMLAAYLGGCSTVEELPLPTLRS